MFEINLSASGNISINLQLDKSQGRELEMIASESIAVGKHGRCNDDIYSNVIIPSVVKLFTAKHCGGYEPSIDAESDAEKWARFRSNLIENRIFETYLFSTQHRDNSSTTRKGIYIFENSKKKNS